LETESEILVKRAKKGDDEAFYQLITVHKMQLYRIALTYLRNEHDAMEAIQETTYRAYKGLRKLREPKYFSTWLIRIMMNYCRDQLKKNKRLVLDDTILQSAQGPAEKSYLEIEEAILKLDEKYRRVIILKYLEDMKIEEIARTLNHPKGTVKTWLHKGLVALRRQFTEDEEGDPHA
jgi:RNA polymerase sigma-70 factor (TIGR02954 family)